MTWNWQKKYWPTFTYDKTALKGLENRLLQQSGMFLGTLKYLDEGEKQTFTVNVMSSEAWNTSEIEGEILNRDSLQSSIRRNFGLETTNKKIAPAENGIADMMVNLYQNCRTSISHTQLWSWHQMLTRGRTDLRKTGAYRTHKEAMQVISGPVHAPKVHFEAPPSIKMKQEMNQFITWFNGTEPKRSNVLPALTRAGIAHLYFICIHPFEDGNGRIGRALAEKALSQSLRHPTLMALSSTINKEKKLYYQALETNNKGLEITHWLVYFAKTIIKAQQASQQLIDFLIEKTRFYDRLRNQLNERQQKVLARMFREGVEGFKGGLSADNYITITETSRATATRDLQDLVNKKAFQRTGERKYTRYYLTLSNSTKIYNE